MPAKKKLTDQTELSALSEKIIGLEHRVFDLTNLLQAGRALDNLLGVNELFSVYASIVRERFGAATLALFALDDTNEQFVLRKGFGLPESLPADFSFPRQEGLLWRAILQGKPFVTADSEGVPRYKIPFSQYGLHQLRSVVFVPLIHQGKVVGLLSVGEKHDGKPYRDDEIEFLHVSAEQAAVAITTAMLYEKNERDRAQLDKTVKNLSILYNIGRALIHINDLKNLLKFILGQAIETTEAQKGSLMLLDQNSGRLVVRVVKGLPDLKTEEAINSGALACRSFDVGEGIAGKVFQTRQPIIANATDDDDRYVRNNDSNVQSILCVPLIASDEPIGVINITNKASGRGFSPQDLELLTALANQAAVAINNAQLYEMAITDELTRLYIRRYFNLKLEGEIRRSKRYGHKMSLVMCDLDRFKSVNDTYGHQMGDVVLQTVAGVLRSNAREMDTPSRFGGEEFAVILPETDADGAVVMAERVRKAVEGLRIEGLPQSITISLGVASFPQHAAGVRELIGAADAALYNAKHQGRNRVCVFAGPVEEDEKKA